MEKQEAVDTSGPIRCRFTEMVSETETKQAASESKGTVSEEPWNSGRRLCIMEIIQFGSGTEALAVGAGEFNLASL